MEYNIRDTSFANRESRRDLIWSFVTGGVIMVKLKASSYMFSETLYGCSNVTRTGKITH